MVLTTTVGPVGIEGADAAPPRLRPPNADKAPGVAVPPAIVSPPSVPAAVPPPGTDATFRSAADREAVLECGRKWASLKRLGTATGTWKEFFARGCVTKQ